MAQFINIIDKCIMTQFPDEIFCIYSIHLCKKRKKEKKICSFSKLLSICVIIILHHLGESNSCVLLPNYFRRKYDDLCGCVCVDSFAWAPTCIHGCICRIFRVSCSCVLITTDI